jgi:asparagine synthase (glutamine-hydrolysing)
LFYDFFNREKLKENYPTPEELLEFFPPDADFWSTFRIKEKVFGPTMSTIPIQNPYYPLIRRKLDNPDLPLAIQQLLFDTWLVSNCLTLGDRVSMSVGVETRLPFLDYEFIELVFGIRQLSPDHSFGHKARLRNALTDILPSDVLNRPKKGFQPPVYE